MSKKYLSTIIFIIVALIIVVGITVISSSGDTPVSSATPSTPATSTASSTSQKYVLSDVVKHNTSTDCWTTINGEVYNVTSWIADHPGGAQAIIGLCGIDGSDAFNGQHGGERRPASELAGFKIGDLSK